MDSNRCGCCSYFQQHYAINKNGKLFRVCCGQCLFNRAKARRPDAKICDNFLQGGSDTSRFATTTYLTKELLQYVLSLPLFPEIEDEPL